MSSYKDYKQKALNNPDVKAEYDALQPEYDLIQAMIDARNKQNITQKELSEITGIGICTNNSKALDVMPQNSDLMGSVVIDR